MQKLALAALLLAGCRGGREPEPVSQGSGSGSAVTAPAAPPAVPADLPKLSSSPDGAAELRHLNDDVARLRLDPQDAAELVQVLTARAAITQSLDDYIEALDRSKTVVEKHAASPVAWKLRITALARVHRFADARAALDKLRALVKEPSETEDLAAMLDEATGHPERAAPIREAIAKILERPDTITILAGNLALRGKLTEAVALIPKAAAAARDNSPVLFSWLYFQWGRLWEQKGELAKARAAYEEAHRRMPGYVEATVHLAQLMQIAGDDPSKLLAEAVETNHYPDLLALAGKVDDAKREWERYVAALPEAFSDHAARFYLGAGKDPLRALALAQANLANRDTPEARSLAVEAALAANAPGEACSLVDPLVTAPLRAHQFIAWRALSACGRKADADKLAAALGIH